MLGLRPLGGIPLASANLTLFSGLLASVGAYTYTGKAVSLVHNYPLVVGAGSYAVTGKDVSFGRSLSPAVLNNVSLTGTNANHIIGFEMITNFEMTAGDSKTLVVTVKDAEGVDVSITGATIKWHAARSFGKTASITKTTSSGIAITDGANGVFTVTLAGSVTESLVGNFYHEAEVTFSDGTVATVLFGTMKINPGIIDAT